MQDKNACVRTLGLKMGGGRMGGILRYMNYSMHLRLCNHVNRQLCKFKHWSNSPLTFFDKQIYGVLYLAASDDRKGLGSLQSTLRIGICLLLKTCPCSCMCVKAIQDVGKKGKRTQVVTNGLNISQWIKLMGNKAHMQSHLQPDIVHGCQSYWNSTVKTNWVN